MENKNNHLPNWLWKNSPLLPQVYHKIWQHVKEDRACNNNNGGGIENLDKYLVDTNKVFPLLLTSQLPTEVLGFIWSLANKKYSGKLTQQELYIVLALIAVAQTSCTFTNLDILFMLPGPPTPTLNLSTILTTPEMILPAHLDKPSRITTTTTAAAADVNQRNVTEYLELSKAQIDLIDDFTEFQSAPAVAVVPTLDPKLGSAIGSRLANHNLTSAPKKIPSSSGDKLNKKTVKCTNFTKDLATLNKNFPDCEKLGGIFPNCMIKNEEKTVILKDTVIRNDTSIPVEREITTSSSLSSSIIKQDLMNLQMVEDKYSALRILIDEPDKLASPLPLTRENEKEDDDNLFDDFGDFVSAVDGGGANTNEIDLFSDFELPNDNNKISLVQETIEAFAQLEINSSPEKTLDYLEEKYDATIDPDKIIQRDTNSFDFDNILLNGSESIASLDLKSFLPVKETTTQNYDDENIDHQTIYWEWKQYMESCVLVLQLAANIFTSITCDTVLQQVLNSAQGYNYLCNLAEVAGVCRRINFSHKEMNINIMGFDDLLMDIDKIWAEMEPFYINIPIVTELPAWPSNQSTATVGGVEIKETTCCLCLTIITSGKIIFNDNYYHATCANLWLNCVNNNNLPILKYTYYNRHSHATSDSN